MRDDDALGLAGRPGRVDHVGGIVGTRDVVGRRVGQRREPGGVAGGHDRLHAGAREPAGDHLVGDDVRDARVAKHVGDALGGQFRVDRHVGAARLQHREPRDGDVRRLRLRHRDERPPGDAGVSQRVGKPVRPRLERPVGERADRLRIGMRRGDLRAAPMHRRRVRIGLRRPVPVDDDPLARRRVHDRQARHRTVRRGGDRRDEHLELPGHPLDRRAIEEVAPVFPVHDDALGAVEDRRRQVELRVAVARRVAPDGRAFEREFVRAVLAHREGHLEDRVSRRVARHPERVDEALERHLLVLERFLHAITHATHHLHVVRDTGQVDADRQRVGEEPDERRELRDDAAAHRRADREIPVVRQPRHQYRERREERDERRRASIAAECGERAGGLPAHRPRHDARGERQRRRTDPVCRQRERRHVGQSPPPESSEAAAAGPPSSFASQTE